MSHDIRPPDPSQDSDEILQALVRARKRAKVSLLALVALSTLYGLSEAASVVLPTLVQLCWFLR